MRDQTECKSFVTQSWLVEGKYLHGMIDDSLRFYVPGTKDGDPRMLNRCLSVFVGTLLCFTVLSTYI